MELADASNPARNEASFSTPDNVLIIADSPTEILSENRVNSPSGAERPNAGGERPAGRGHKVFLSQDDQLLKLHLKNVTCLLTILS